MLNFYRFLYIFSFMLMFDFFRKCQSSKESLFATKNRYPYNEQEFQHKHCDINSGCGEKKCKLMQINAVFRHGTRNPGRKDILRSREFMTNSGYDEWNTKYKDLLSTWPPNFNLDNEKDLTEAGIKEMALIGKSYGAYFNMSKLLINQTLFLTSDMNRTIGSCTSFQKGFYGHRFSVNKMKCKVRNDLLRFFDMCKKYNKEVETSENALKEVKLFRKGKEVKIAMSNISMRLDIKNFDIMNYKFFKALYTVAGVEVANFGNTPWTSILTTDELKIFEYAADLKSYWKKSYGHKVNYEQSCVLLKDMFTHLQGAVHNQMSYHGVFRFGHAETLLPLMSLMGLFKDKEPLRADNYKEQANRIFRTGHITPFGANLALLLYKCESSYKVLLLHNQVAIHLPCCPDTFLCPYEQVKQFYDAWIDKCDFSAICKLKDEL